MNKERKISEAEWEVMTAVWAKEPVAVVDIVESVSAKRRWTSRTIRTLIDRLAKKGVLVFGNEKPRLYRSLVSMNECIRQESQGLLERAFGGEPASMLMHLVKESKLSKAEIAQLKKILTEKEK